jgi:hypothetical protein
MLSKLREISSLYFALLSLSGTKLHFLQNLSYFASDVEVFNRLLIAERLLILTFSFFI